MLSFTQVKQASAKVAAKVRGFVADEDGLSATEYVILFLVVVVFIIAGASILGPLIVDAFARGGAALP